MRHADTGVHYYTPRRYRQPRRAALLRGGHDGADGRGPGRVPVDRAAARDEPEALSAAGWCPRTRVPPVPGGAAAPTAPRGRDPRHGLYNHPCMLKAEADRDHAPRTRELAPARRRDQGEALGGFLGGRLARILPPALMRAIVIAVGAALTVIYAHRYWLS